MTEYCPVKLRLIIPEHSDKLYLTKNISHLRPQHNNARYFSKEFC